MSAYWEDFELQCLYDMVNDADWFDHAERLIRGRSPNAIRAKMSALRKEAGIVPKHLGAKAKSRRMTEYERAEEGSRKLLNAMLEMAA
jgi:hypothetical protein